MNEKKNLREKTFADLSCESHLKKISLLFTAKLSNRDFVIEPINFLFTVHELKVFLRRKKNILFFYSASTSIIVYFIKVIYKKKVCYNNFQQEIFFCSIFHKDFPLIVLYQNFRTRVAPSVVRILKLSTIFFLFGKASERYDFSSLLLWQTKIIFYP